MSAQLMRLVRGRDWQWQAIAITAMCVSLTVSMGLWLGWPLWGLGLALIAPVVPLVSMKVMWSSRHYGFMGIFLAIMILQLGHMGEHIAQMIQFIVVIDPTTSPPCNGWRWQGGCGAAHGIFGALNTELVHFVWDGLVLAAALLVRYHFRHVKNVWLTLMVVTAGFHQVEHIYLYGMYVLYNETHRNGGTVFGIEMTGAQVRAGLLGHGGVVGSLFPAINGLLPSRINLHFIYNSAVMIPFIVGFLKQTRYIYDEWLAKALPRLNQQQLVAATERAETVTFPAGATIFRQGEPADKMYIISKGQVEVLRQERSGAETQLATLAEGQFFGEIGVLGRTARTATVRTLGPVECLALDLELFKAMMASSSETFRDVDVVLRRRLVQIGAVHGLAIKSAVEADADTALKTMMIRDRLQLIQDLEARQLMGGSSSSRQVAYANQPAFLQSLSAAQSTAPLRAARPVMVPVALNGLYGTLEVQTGGSAGKRFELRAKRVLIGRRSEISQAGAPLLMVADNRVSRQHIEIAIKDDGMYVRDLNSANGSWLNGNSLKNGPLPMDDGAVLQLGPDTRMVFRAVQS